MRSMNFFLTPQYIVLEPAKMRYFQLKSTIYCGRVKLANRFEILYHVRSTASHRTPHQLRCTAPPHSKRTAHCLPACTLPSKQRPVKAAHLHSKRTAPLTSGGSSKPAQHSAHTTAQFIASAFQNRRWRTRAKLKGRYWCTLKSKHRTARIQLHHRVTVVLPAPVV